LRTAKTFFGRDLLFLFVHYSYLQVSLPLFNTFLILLLIIPSLCHPRRHVPLSHKPIAAPLSAHLHNNILHKHLYSLAPSLVLDRTRKPYNLTWPGLAVEVGFSEGLAALGCDAKWWLESSHTLMQPNGILKIVVEQVVIVKVSLDPMALTIESWELAPIPHITRNRGSRGGIAQRQNLVTILTTVITNGAATTQIAGTPASPSNGMHSLAAHQALNRHVIFYLKFSCKLNFIE
jgi:hypothetical protein